MCGTRSRDKGKRGEREIVALAKACGFPEAERTAALQAGGKGHADVKIAAPIHAEVKRDERLSVDAMVRQATGDAPDGIIPVVFWRRNGGRWRADVPAEHYLRLLAQAEATA